MSGPQQLSLLNPPAQPAARARDPETSKIAAASMRQGAAAQRAKVLAALTYLRQATYTEIAVTAGLERHAVARRLPELRALGKVRRLTATRPTPSHRPAHLWEAV